MEKMGLSHEQAAEIAEMEVAFVANIRVELKK